MSLSAYATSAFSKHSLISTVLVVQNVVNGKNDFAPSSRLHVPLTVWQPSSSRPWQRSLTSSVASKPSVSAS